MKRIKVYIVLLIVIFSGYIFSKEIKNYLFKEEVNLLYKESDFIEPIDWDEYKSMFPEDFSPTKVIINIEELSKLNVDQKKKYDSIRNKDLRVNFKDANEKIYLKLLIPEKLSVELNRKR